MTDELTSFPVTASTSSEKRPTKVICRAVIIQVEWDEEAEDGRCQGRKRLKPVSVFEADFPDGFVGWLESKGLLPRVE